MKIKKLHIYNIASIEDQTIDWTSEPLSGSDVFLITGKTGAGKSTILDAICLALYKTTPRLKDNSNKNVANNSDNLALNDSRQLMRQNTGEAMVELWFEGIDGRDYLATWQVQRGKLKKLDTSLSPATWSLKELETGKVTSASNTKDSEVREAIQKVVGLEFDQFCRTTMLAQGEFTKFLKSNETEKSAILAKVTQCTEYAEIGRRIYEITKQKKTAYERAAEAASDTGLDIKDLATLIAEIESLKKDIDALTVESKAAGEKKSWLEDYHKFALALNDKKLELDKLASVMSSEEFKSKETLISDWDKSIEARQALESSLLSESRVDTLTKEIDQYSKDYSGFRAGLCHLDDSIRGIEDLIKNLESYFESERINKSLYEKSQTVISSLQQIKKLRSNIARISTEKASDLKKKESLTATVEAAQKELLSVTDVHTQMKDKITSLETQLSEKHLPELRKQKEDNATLLYNIDSAKKSLKALDAAKTARKDSEESLKSSLDAIALKEREVESLKQPIHDAEIKVSACEEILSAQKATVEDWTKTLRSKLKLGDKCPVCQQTVHSIDFDEEEISKVYLSAEEAYKKAKVEFDALNEKSLASVSEASAMKKQYDKEKAAFDKDTTLDLATKAASSDCRKCGIGSIDENTFSVLEEREISLGKAREDLIVKIAEAEKIETAISSERKACDSYQKEVVSVKNDIYVKAKDSLDRIISSIASKEAVIENDSKSLASIEEEVTMIVPIELWNDCIDKYSEDLKNKADTYVSNQKLLEDRKKEYEKLTESKNQISETFKKIEEIEPEWRNLSCQENSPVENLFDKVNALYNNLSKKNELLRNEKQNAESMMRVVKDFVYANPSLTVERLKEISAYAGSIASVKESVNKDKESLIEVKSAFNQISSQLSEHESKKPSLSDEDTVESLALKMTSLDSEKGSKNQMLGSKNQLLLEDNDKKSRLGDLTKAKDEADKEYIRWKALCDLLGDATGHTFQIIAQSYVLGGLLNSANEYLKSLAPRYTLKAVPGTLHISLEDAYQGFATRSTDGLSGGESFLVSLALALALSDIGQGLEVDTLFIDEGFGTLSGAPLTNAINTLRNLHNKSGRHVGIISHIEEVKDNIPVQIQVLQEGTSSSSTIKIVPES